MSLVKLAFEKEAGLWDGLAKGVLAGGKALMTNNTLRNAAIGAGTGAVVGGLGGIKNDNVMGGALKGALGGGLVGGLGTAAKNIAGNMKPSMGPGMSFGGALQQEAKLVTNTAKNAVDVGKTTKLAEQVKRFNPNGIAIKTPDAQDLSKLIGN